MPELIGHQAVLGFFDSAIRRERLAHAYLLVGPEAVGKSALVRALAQKMFGGAASLAQHPDFTEIARERDAKTGKLHGEIVLDQIKALRTRLNMGSLMGGWKIAFIDGADLMNTEASNALLKTLEEPRPRTLLFLTAESKESVEPTIRSRCQEIRVGRVPALEIRAALESRGVAGDRAALLARLADGRPGRALSFLEDPTILDEMLTFRKRLLDASRAGIADRWAAAEKFLPAKMPFQESVERVGRIIDLAAELLRDALLIEAGSDALIHADAVADTTAWSGIGRNRLAAALAAAIESKKMLAENVNPKAVLDHFFLSLSSVR